MKEPKQKDLAKYIAKTKDYVSINSDTQIVKYPYGFDIGISLEVKYETKGDCVLAHEATESNPEEYNDTFEITITEAYFTDGEDMEIKLDMDEVELSFHDYVYNWITELNFN